MVHVLPGSPAFTLGRLTRKLSAITGATDGTAAFVHLVKASRALTADELSTLTQLLTYGPTQPPRALEGRTPPEASRR